MKVYGGVDVQLHKEAGVIHPSDYINALCYAYVYVRMGRLFTLNT
jgi:hypothetical protein